MPTQTKPKNILIAWSGGLDSTYLVQEALKGGHQVYTYSTQLENNRTQTEREERARKKLLEYFNKKYPSKISTDDSLSKFGCKGTSMALPQIPLWMLFNFYSHNVSTIDEIWIGYVMNDDAISYIDDIKKLYKSFSPFLPKDTKLPKLVFPAIKLQKWEILNQMDEKVVDMISWCEDWMGIDNCIAQASDINNTNCFCVSCKKHLDAWKISKYYHKIPTKNTESSKCVEGPVDTETRPIEKKRPVEIQGVLFPEMHDIGIVK